MFIVEQNCAYLDADDLDTDALHVVMLNETGRLIAYSRLLAPGISYELYASIGRIVTDADFRHQGLATDLVQYSINKVRQLHPHSIIKISAQTYLLEWYQSLGFKVTGPEYLEDGIPHQAMIHID